MTARLAITAATALVVGCGVLRPPPFPSDQSEPVRLVAQADELAESGSPRNARQLYLRVVREHPTTPAAADALYGLGQLYVDPKSPLRDYAAAHAAFGRLIAEHPVSPRAVQARAWHAALGDLLRSQADATRLRSDLEQLKRFDLEQERNR